MAIERRTDCEDFEPKRWPHDCGDCQTDGHYLCAGCKHIAPFEEMELADTRMGYYPKQEKERIKIEEEALKEKCNACGEEYLDILGIGKCSKCFNKQNDVI